MRVEGSRSILVARLACVAMSLHSLTTVAQSVTGADADSNPQKSADIYKAPYVKNADDIKELGSGSLGVEAAWAELVFMVDANGRPFEATVIGSSGNKVFDREAVSSIQQSRFQPGTLNGKPIESTYQMKYTRSMGLRKNIHMQFSTAYDSLMESIQRGDRAAADASRQRLKIRSLYEDAQFGFASYSYSAKWGDESEQVEGLKRAIAWEYTPRLLPLQTFRVALLKYLQFELKNHEYAEAVVTAKSLQNSGLDPDTAAEIKAALDKLEKLRTDGSSYEVAGSILEQSWFLHLFKQNFRVIVTEGQISDVKIRCDRRYAHWPFESDRPYQVSADKDGSCSIELIGSSGARFRLVQF